MPPAVSLLPRRAPGAKRQAFSCPWRFKRRCAGCRLVPSHCMCAVRPPGGQRAPRVCLLMADIEPLKPTNTGWLVADLGLADTFAFG